MQAKYELIPAQQRSSFVSYLRTSTQYLFEMHYHPFALKHPAHTVWPLAN